MTNSSPSIRKEEERIPEWISKGLDKDAIEFTRTFGKELTNPNNEPKEALTTSQIRNVYGEVLRM
ncbi:MAG: hypothetical protein N2053_13090, partial [Chitinispirillaceae bacterium]|nr:hypothetical protein [Chitinispirillaceae bacterium]